MMGLVQIPVEKTTPRTLSPLIVSRYSYSPLDLSSHTRIAPSIDCLWMSLDMFDIINIITKIGVFKLV